MSTLIRVIAAALLVVSLSLTSVALARERKLLGIAVADMRPDLFSDITASVESESRAKGFNVDRVDAREDVTKQISQIKEMIAQHINAVVYIPAGAVLSGVPVRDARKAGIPIVAVYGNPLDSPADSFIGTDNVTAMETLGEYMCKVTHGSAKVAVIRGLIGMAPEVERSIGLKKAIAKCPGLSVVAEQSSSTWSRADGIAIARRMLSRHPDITVIFGQADLLALGAADALRDAHRGHHIDIFGFDGDLAGLKAVRNGVLTATMAHQSRLMGSLALRSAMDLIAKRPVPRVQMQSAILVTKANVSALMSRRP